MDSDSSDLETPADRLRWAMARRNVRPVDIWKPLEIDSGAMTRTMSGFRRIQPKEAPIIANILGVRVEWLMYGTLPIYADEAPNIDGHIVRVSLDEETRAYTRGHYSPAIPGAVPEVDVAAGAGEGTVGEIFNIQVGDDTISGHKVVAEWKMPEEYLRYELRLSGRDTIVIPVHGDSMSPTYRSGDRVIVDLRHRDFGDDGVYLITDGNSAPRIKRLEYIFNSTPPAVRILSDNPAGREQTSLLDDIHIVGRIAGRITR